jgi:predicted transcriptional regulator
MADPTPASSITKTDIMDATAEALALAPSAIGKKYLTLPVISNVISRVLGARNVGQQQVRACLEDLLTQGFVEEGWSNGSTTYALTEAGTEYAGQHVYELQKTERHLKGLA